jgi:hypothetical protein
MSRMAGPQHTDDARASTRKLTYRDFLLFPDDGRRHELMPSSDLRATAADTLTTPLLPGFTLALADYFR